MFGDGALVLCEDNASGLTGRVMVAYSGDDADIELTCYKTHYVVWDSLLDIGQNYQPDVRLRLKTMDGEAVDGTASYVPHISEVYHTYVDNTP